MAYDDQDYYTSSSSSSEKKWKLFKKDNHNNNNYNQYNQSSSSTSSYGVDPSLMRSYSHKNTSSKSPPFLRSFSQKPSSKLSRSSSLKTSCPCSPTSTKNKSNLVRNFSKKSSAFGKKCSHLAKEQKARFYIMKRCVSMLVSWPKKGDS